VIYTVTQETLIYKGEKVQTFSVFKDPIRITHKPSFTVTYGSRKKSVYSKEYGLMKQWLWDDAKGDSLYFSRELIAELAPRPLLP